MLSYNSPNFVGKCFATISGHLGVKHLRTTACEPHTDGHMGGSQSYEIEFSAYLIKIHVDKGNSLLHDISRYGYGPKDNTVEHAQHFP